MRGEIDPMVNSMTGFATLKAEATGLRRLWEVRSVNGRGLDLRLRLPEGFEALEPYLRKELGARFGRGNITVNLRVQREQADAKLTLNTDQLDHALAALAATRQAAERAGMTLGEATPADILAIRGVFDATPEDLDMDAQVQAAKRDVAALLDDFATARGEEGAALLGIITGQLDQIEALVTQSRDTAGARAAKTAETLRENVTRLLDSADGLDEARLAQELALLAVKGDVTEELDRLDAHIAQARGLVKKTVPVGRKLDFLMQEFNREANTLCSKSSDAALTALGLELKTLIDQMREQVQNVE